MLQGVEKGNFKIHSFYLNLCFRPEASLIYPSFGSCSNETDELYSYRDLTKLAMEYVNFNGENLLNTHLSTRNFGVFHNDSGLYIDRVLAAKFYVHKFEKVSMTQFRK